MSTQTRRGFLQLAGAATLTGALAGCTSKAGQPSGPSGPSASSVSATGGSSGSPPASPRATVTPSDYSALDRSLGGRLVRPGEPTYDRARELFNPRFDSVKPQAVAQCAGSADVVEVIGFARKYGLPLAIRSGGHCYAGWSVGPGLVVDVTPMSSVTVQSGSAVVGAGTRLIDFYNGLSTRGVAVPGGSCPSVGIAGLTLGGGIGVLDRAWGLTCDNLTAVTIVTADGTVRTCDAGHDPDLLWASQGGGGGSFGVATSFTFRTRPVQTVTTWFLQWPWAQAARVVAGWLKYVPGAPDQVWGSVHLGSNPNGSEPVVEAVGTFLGRGDLGAELDRLIGLVGSEPSERTAGEKQFLDAMLREAGCQGQTVAECHLEPAGLVQRQAYAGSSDWITTPLSAGGIATLLRAVQARHDTSGAPDVAVELDAAGGAINRVRPDATAFVHRDAICSVQYIANWYGSTPAAQVTAAAAWPHQTRQAMARFVSGQAYQNYADPAIENSADAYFGGNYRRLQKIKYHYDPDDLFSHPQGIRPA